jgi:N-acyl-phosphatidylethanolamine-hydrolysing phospholipase D
MDHPESLVPEAWRKGNRFLNPHTPKVKRGLWHVLLWQLGYYDEVAPVLPVPEDFAYPNAQLPVDFSAPTVTWINHTTFLVRLNGVSLLTDPLWSDRCSPLGFIGPKRLFEPPIPLDTLPQIDYVLISHDHYDHLDRKTVIRLAKQYPELTWLVPLGVSRLLRRWGIRRIVELDWWQTYEAKGLSFTAVPAQHFSGRTLLDSNQTLWCGWVVRDGRPGQQRCLYFAGDTGYNPIDFKKIGGHLGSFDLSLIPIGAYLPRAFMSPVHASPEDAVAIHVDCRSTLSVASHWGTFRLSSESSYQPPYDLYLTLLEKGLPHETFRVLEPGQSVNW